MTWRRAAAAAIALTMAAIAATGGGCGNETPAGAGAKASAPAALVEVADLDGLARRLGATGARLTVVNFWATWCVPCVAEIPDLLAAVEAVRDRSVAVVLVSYDLNTPGTDLTEQSVVPFVRSFVERHHLDADVLIYTGATPELDLRYDLPGPIPATILLDAKGSVVARHAGAMTRAQFDEWIGAALAK
jgi:thiol-disulfide isomerase/thioredoxin